MRPLLLLSWAGVLLCSASLLLAFGRRASLAHSHCADAIQSLGRIRSQAQELRDCEHQRPLLPTLPRNQNSLGTRLTAVVASSGLPTSALGSVQPHDDHVMISPNGAQRYVRRRTQLTLSGVTLPKLGSFLQAWRAAEPDWVPAAIEINPTPSKAGYPGGDSPLNVNITLEALFEDTSGVRR